MSEKTARKEPKPLQFDDSLGNLIKFGCLVVLIIGVYEKFRIIVRDGGLR